MEPEVVAQGVASLEELFPLLKGAAPRVEATVFAGFKQNVDGQMTRRLFSRVDNKREIYLALPSVLVHAFTNARDAVNTFGAAAVPPSKQLAPAPVHDLPRATVGHVNELKAGVEWSPWSRFRNTYRLSPGTSGS